MKHKKRWNLEKKKRKRKKEQETKKTGREKKQRKVVKTKERRKGNKRKNKETDSEALNRWKPKKIVSKIGKNNENLRKHVGKKEYEKSVKTVKKNTEKK